ncbi:MAG: hypothetical protein ACPG5M_09345 [Winogradskyella sp.]
MRKFIINSIAFLFFSVLFYSIALLLWGSVAPASLKPNLNYRMGSYGHMFSRLYEVKNTTDVDVLFLGSSHAYRGFDTRIFSKHNLKTFNLGSSAQTPKQTKVLLNRYLERINPKLVIYEVYPETFMFDGIESSLDIIANDHNDFDSFKMTLNHNHLKVYNTFLYGAIRNLFNLNQSFTEPINKEADTYIPGGFVEKEIKYFKPIPFEDKKIALNEDQLQEFSKIVSKLKNEDYKVVLVYAPITPTYYSSYTNTRYFDSVMKTHSEYYNFNKLIRLEDSLHFYDKDHLNKNGVNLFNEKLIKVLEKDKVLLIN